MRPWGEKISEKLPPVSKVCDVVNGPTPSSFLSVTISYPVFPSAHSSDPCAYAFRRGEVKGVWKPFLCFFQSLCKSKISK